MASKASCVLGTTVTVTGFKGISPAVRVVLRSKSTFGKATPNIGYIQILRYSQQTNRLYRINQNRKYTSKKHIVSLSEVDCAYPFFKTWLGDETFDGYLL